ncbi:MAG: hypothetical protein MJZ74_09820, partial [Muribaculaceae bacterium]|nr:hypothetical protein [Muribaculaceae bacterium]
MRIKFLLFTLLAMVLSFASNAETSHSNNGDRLSAQDFTIEAGQKNVEVKLMLERKNSQDFTNIQFDIEFPEGIRPCANANGKFGTAGDDVMGENGAIVNFSHNMDRTEFYPNHRVVGTNMLKIPIEANPAHIYTFYVQCDENVKSGTYKLLAKGLKYTSYNDDLWANGNSQEICTITVDGTAPDAPDTHTDNGDKLTAQDFTVT